MMDDHGSVSRNPNSPNSTLRTPVLQQIPLKQAIAMLVSQHTSVKKPSMVVSNAATRQAETPKYRGQLRFLMWCQCLGVQDDYCM